MWPWEHLAVGYLLVSFWRRWRGTGPPREREVLAVAVGTQFPDLVDKPLAWSTTLPLAGRSLAHSLVVAVPLIIGVYLCARRHRLGEAAIAFALGYLSHLPTDALYPAAFGEPLGWRFLVWPLVPLQSGRHTSFFGTVLEFMTEFAFFLSTPRGLIYLLGEFLLLLVTLYLWRCDGWPGLASLHTVALRLSPVGR